MWIIRVLLKIGPGDVNRSGSKLRCSEIGGIGTIAGPAGIGIADAGKIVEKTVALPGRLRNFFRLIFGFKFYIYYG
jgi:hypothetical protein